MKPDSTHPTSSSHRTAPSPHGNTTLSSIATVGFSSLYDTLTSRNHSKDFSYARGNYLRKRVVVIGLIFLALMPLWTIIDLLMLPRSTLAYTVPARVAMLIGLIVTLILARKSRGNILASRLCTGLLLALPATFYALVLITLLQHGGHSLIGYSFIPYMLVTMLSVFPLTLIESIIAGSAMVILQLLSQHITGTWMTAAGLQEAWLLLALLVITLTANYFHLGLLLRLYREATHDPLTSLLNRGALLQNLEQISTTRPRPAISLLMIDLDHFKRINDEHGHSVGDLVLQEFAQQLRLSVRDHDLVARYGGEEFIAVLIDTDKDHALTIAEKIRSETERMQVRNHNDEHVALTVSIGVASYQEDDTFDSAIRRADERMYRAKRKSRNYVVGDIEG